MPSVGATVNTMLVAVKAQGITTINNAAKEPEIVNIATLLNNMGAKIKGAGTSEIKIEGVENLHRATIEVIPDRIEAGTYMIIAALTGKDLIIENIIPEHLESLIQKLKESGANIDENGILRFKGFQIKEVPETKFQKGELAYVSIVGVGKQFTGINTARTIESEDFDGVAFQGAGKAGEFILPANKKAVIKVVQVEETPEG